MDAPPAAGATGYDSYVSDSGAPGALPTAADPGHLLRRRLQVVDRGWSKTSASWITRSMAPSWETPPLTSDSTIAGEVLARLFALDHRHRRRLDRQAHRRLSQFYPEDGRWPAIS